MTMKTRTRSLIGVSKSCQSGFKHLPNWKAMAVQHKHLGVRIHFEARSRITASWLPILQGIYHDGLLSLGEGKVQVPAYRAECD